MLEYARWKYFLVATVLILALFFALPNFFGEDAALQLARKDHAAIDVAAERTVEKFLSDQKIALRQDLHRLRALDDSLSERRRTIEGARRRQ